MYLKLWIPEISALVGTGAMTGALVGLLLVYNGQTIFDWYSVTLNTIVSTLSVAMKALLLFAAAECIGQWKWIMLHRSTRTLIDFERVDQASRGPLGCFNLLWRKETPWLLRLGLFTIILTIAVDPFSQQLLQLDHRTVYNMTMNYGVAEAQIPAAAKYVLGDVYNASQTLSSSKHIYRTQINAAKAQLDFSMQSAILNGLVKPKEEAQKSLRFDCPTGNCTWEPFVTLGVCHRCNDLTDQLERVDGLGEFLKYIWNNEYDWGNTWHGHSNINGTALVLPNGHFMPNEDECAGKDSWMSCAQSGMSQDVFAMTTYGTGNRSRTNTFQDMDTLIWSMSAIYVDGDEYDTLELESRRSSPEEKESEDYMAWSKWPNTPVSAVECAAYFCLKTVQDEVRDNTIFENATELDGVTREFPGQYEGRVDDGAEVVDTLEMIEDNKNYTLVQDALVLAGGIGKWGLTFRGEMPYRSYAAISVFLRETLTAAWTDESAALAPVRDRIPGITELYNGQVRGQKGAIPPALSGIWGTFRVRLEESFEGLAVSMTNELRNSAGREPVESYESYDGWNDGAEQPMMAGMTGFSSVVYRVVWYWITLHGVLLLASVFFCAMTMILSRGIPVWKSHSLATMSQGHTIVDFGPEARTLEDLEMRAGKVEVSLALNEKMKLLEERPDSRSSG